MKHGILILFLVAAAGCESGGSDAPSMRQQGTVTREECAAGMGERGRWVACWPTDLPSSPPREGCVGGDDWPDATAAELAQGAMEIAWGDAPNPALRRWMCTATDLYCCDTNSFRLFP